MTAKAAHARNMATAPHDRVERTIGSPGSGASAEAAGAGDEVQIVVVVVARVPVDEGAHAVVLELGTVVLVVVVEVVDVVDVVVDVVVVVPTVPDGGPTVEDTVEPR
jgi:hypothetical protein